MRKTLLLSVIAAALWLTVLPADAGQTQWTWTYSPAAGENASATVTPIKFGKKWAYAVEIDDGPISTLSNAQPLLANYRWTDAPTGVAGGNVHPIVGGMSIYPLRVEGNSTLLSWANVATLMDRGWGIINHGYWHSGYGWDPAGYLTPAEFRRELFWSQQIIGMKAFNSEYTTIHHVYPNGYEAYGAYLNEFGLYSGSAVNNWWVRTMTASGFNLLKLPRTYLDEANWTGSGGSNPMYQFPTGGPGNDDIFIDFTHNIDAPGSANYIRWQTRLATIQNTYGINGTDEFWCAPTGDIIAYYLTRKQASVQASNGTVTLTIPDNLPGTAMTIKLTNVNPASQMTAPEGGLLYRQGTTVWITTPVLNTPGSPLPQPDMELAYQGNFQSHVTLPGAISLAAVRIHSLGDIPAGYYPTITLNKADGSSEVLDVSAILDQSELGSGWGKWYLFPTLPDIPAIAHVVSVDIANCNAFKTVEIYSVGPLPQGPTLEWASADVGNGLTQYTFTIRNDDGLQKPYAAAIGFEGLDGAVIYQAKAFGAVTVNTETDATNFNAMPAANYAKAEDSWVYGPFVGTLGVNPLTGQTLNGYEEGPAGAYYAFSVTSGSGSALYDNVPLAQIVSNGAISWTGTLTRNGNVFDISGQIETSVVLVPGDYNGDGYVDLADYTVWADHYGQTGSHVPGDGNSDGVVDLADYTVWADHYGQGTPPAMTAEE